MNEPHPADLIVPGDPYRDSVTYDGTLGDYVRAVRDYLAGCPDHVVLATFEFGGVVHTVTRAEAVNVQ